MPKSTDRTKRTAGARGARGKAAHGKRAAAKRAPAKAGKRAPASLAPAAGAHAAETPAPPREIPAGGGSRQQQRLARTWKKTVTIEQFGSGIQCPIRQKRILRSLGLKRPNQRVVRPDNDAIRGMVAAIPHLVRIVEGQDGR